MSSTRVYLGRLSNNARERDVERFFKGYGKIREILLKDGYGFIEFDEARDADDAVYELNGKELMGDRVIVEHAKPPGSSPRGGRFDAGGRGFGGGYGGSYGGVGYGGPGGRYGFSRAPPMRGRNPPPLRTDYRVLVENLSSKVSWQDLKDYMRQAGEVTYADAHKVRQNEGVVEFATSSDMRTALSKLNNTDLCGRKIKLIEDSDRGGSTRRRSRSRSDSRDRSRSRSKSRSHSKSRSRSKSPANQSRSRSVDRGSAARQSRSRSP